MLTVRFIRHGESLANAGHVTAEPHAIPLTQKGRDQAQALSAGFNAPPEFIISSPYLRALDTAAPMVTRFPGTPVEIWPVQEITCLTPERCIGTTSMQRAPWVKAFWSRADPDAREGAGAESYVEFVARVRAALTRLSALPHRAAVVFSHGQFMKAVHWEIMKEGPPITPETMLAFRAYHLAAPIANGGGFIAHWDGQRWRF